MTPFDVVASIILIVIVCAVPLAFLIRYLFTGGEE